MIEGQPYIELYATLRNYGYTIENTAQFSVYDEDNKPLHQVVIGKTGNYKSVATKAKSGKVTLRKGGTFRLGAKGVPAVSKLKVKVHEKIRYESSDPKTASVSAKGVIKARKKGTCKVYAYAQNGAAKAVKVTVK